MSLFHARDRWSPTKFNGQYFFLGEWTVIFMYKNQLICVNINLIYLIIFKLIIFNVLELF